MKSKPFWRKSHWWIPLLLLCGGLYTELFVDEISVADVGGFGIIVAGVLYLRLNDIYHRLEEKSGDREEGEAALDHDGVE